MTMNLDNLIKCIIFVLAIAIPGCGGSIHTEWRGARGHGHHNVVETSLDSTGEFETCRAERREQRDGLLCDAGILTGARCTPEASEEATVAVSFHETIQALCEMNNAREARGEDRAISRDECTRLLSGDDSTIAVAHSAPETTTTVTDPYILRILTMNPALWQDDHAFCMNATSSYGVPGSGGVYSGGNGGSSGMYLPAGSVVGVGPAPIVPVTVR